MAPRKIPRWTMVVGVIIAAIVVVVAVFRWDWFIPIVQSRASAALGRQVTIGHLHVGLGRVTTITADHVTIADPAGFPPDRHLATIDRLRINVDLAALIRHHTLRIPEIDIQHPVADVATSPDGKPNYKFKTGPSSQASPALKIGDVRIEDGHAHIVIPKLKSDFELTIKTREKTATHEAELVAEANGTYAGQPITGTFVGGALLNLRDPTKPYPVDLHLANGDTKVALVGTVEDPLHFKGTQLKLEMSGPDMSKLEPLTGVPTPQTTPYTLSGKLDYADGRLHFTDIAGKVGHSDLSGSIAIDPGPERPIVTADLSSHSVDLKDLGGFIGATPGTKATSATPEQKREHAEAEATPGILPNTPINLPKLRSADVNLSYHGQRIEGRSMPLDNLHAKLDIAHGHINLHPLSFGVGQGEIAANLELTGESDQVHARGDIEFHRVDVARLMAATHMFGGAGTIGGRAELDGTGNSVAAMVANGNGDVKLFMMGGDLSALLVDLSGLEFGDALLSALGMPKRTPIRCMAIDLPLQHGILDTKVLVVDTADNDITAKGTVDFRDHRIDYQIRTEPKHFTIGSLPAPIDVRGPLKKPSIAPDTTALAARGGAAVVLGALLSPLAALLPTIQLGSGKETDCGKLIAEVGEHGRNRLSTGEIHKHIGH